ncbi:MAG: dihydroxy-acid dehydratase [Alphaproteobacteria bacterium]|nr:MAG: dihydroxy-acid dehydratase [Alphaproteobacteria bacterium]
MTKKKRISEEDLRSREWFNDPEDPGMTALYLERYLNFGLTVEELQSNRPIIGIAQTGSDLAPCNRHHMVLADRVKDGIRDGGGIPLEFPIHPIQETGRRPTAAIDRNLQCISLTEILHGYPIDGVVLTTGCDKTTPAQIMAASSVDIPAIALSVGPMLNGNYLGQCVGSGTVIWEARQRLAKGEIDYQEFMTMAAESAPSAGHCNTMGTALSMNCIAEALGMSLPGNASIPAPYRERQQMAYATGRRIVDMVWEDLKPSDIITRESIENAIVICGAVGGSTNAPVHVNAIAAHAGVEVTMDDWQEIGHPVPQIVNCQPIGEYLSEDFHRAGGVPAVLSELMKGGYIREGAMTANGRTIGENCAGKLVINSDVIKTTARPLAEKAGFMVLSGNMFTSALMKVSAISDDFRARYLSDPDHPNAFTATAVIFDGPEQYHGTIEDPSLNITEDSILVMRGAGPVGYPGSAEVVNMQAPAYLLKRGIADLPTMGDGRQSGTSSAPSILNISPEAAVGGGLGLLRPGDKIRVDLNKRTVDLLLSEDEMDTRRSAPPYKIPEAQTWWQQEYRDKVSGLDKGAVFEDMVKYRDIVKKTPRHSH